MNLVILGPQGSGKGTQAEKLARKFNLEHIDMGKFLREVAVLDTPLGKEINEIINVRKELVSDEVLKKVLHIKLADLPREKGITFDGVPRSFQQSQYFKNALLEFGRQIDKIFVINLSEEESIKRISIRRVCKSCKSIYILGKDIKNEKEKCPKCQGKIILRPDDSPGGVIKRLKIFKKETLPVIDFFEEKGLVIKINGEQTQEEVFEDILKSLRNS